VWPHGESAALLIGVYWQTSHFFLWLNCHLITPTLRVSLQATSQSPKNGLFGWWAPQKSNFWAPTREGSSEKKIRVIKPKNQTSKNQSLRGSVIWLLPSLVFFILVLCGSIDLCPFLSNPSTCPPFILPKRLTIASLVMSTAVTKMLAAVGKRWGLHVYPICDRYPDSPLLFSLHEPSINTLGQPLWMAVHVSDWGDSLRITGVGGANGTPWWWFLCGEFCRCSMELLYY